MRWATWRNRLRPALGAGLLAALATAAAARDPKASISPSPLPPELRSALVAARVPTEAVSLLVEEAGSGQPRLIWQSRLPMNPASVTKLVTTYAALDLLGPAYTWRTPVWLDGPVRDGVLDGSLVIQGQGDPKFTHERVWQLLRRVRLAGVREIAGDIVLDRRAFAEPERAPADFDGEPLRAYNVQPDALLLAHKALTVAIAPDPGAGIAHLAPEPALDGLDARFAVPLDPGPCNQWRADLNAEVPSERALAFGGHYAAACGERAWLLADPQPASFNARLLRATWLELGGHLAGGVRDGPAPAGKAPTFELESPALAEIVRDINKYSNNVMAEQLFLTLAATQRPGTPATTETARSVLRDWLQRRTGELADNASIDNGSGLSRTQRLSAELLARLLQQAWASAVMPELMASLPVNGVDGTLRRSRATAGRSHLKTGSLRDVAALAGYALSHSGRRYVVVALVNHANASATRPAFDALVQWVLQDAGLRQPIPR